MADQAAAPPREEQNWLRRNHAKQQFLRLRGAV